MTRPDRLNVMTEKDLKTLIRECAVLSVDPIVHRVLFSNLKQDQGESFQKYVPKLKVKTGFFKKYLFAAPGQKCLKMIFLMIKLDLGDEKDEFS